MTSQHTNFVTRNRNIVRIVCGTASILLVPLIAMLLTDEVDWGPGDFAAAGSLLIGTGLLYELVLRKVHNSEHRA